MQAFVAVVEQGTVHAAARVLGLTQTAVTHRLQQLEAELATSLFIRSRRGMQLTESGEALDNYCRQVLDMEGEALAKIQSVPTRSQVRFRLQGPSSVLRSRILALTAKVAQRFPHVALEVSMADLVSGAQMLRNGNVDLAVLPENEVAREFDSRKIKPERYILVGPTKWRQRELAEVVAEERIIDFDATDDMTFAWLRKHGLRKRVILERHFLNNTDALAAMVAEGAGYSVLSAEFARDLIAEGKICDLGQGRYIDYPLALAWYPRKHLPPFWQELLRALAAK
jgi:DNA-binding transcriptional LysR family regulator